MRGPARRGILAGMGTGLVELVVFADRADAGRRLGVALATERAGGAAVVGLARGGVVVAAEAARLLGLPLDVVAVRKVRHPWQPEYGIGAVTPGDGLYLRGPDGLSEAEVQLAVTSAQRQAADLDTRLHARRPALDLAGLTTILVDDGLATGGTMVAAVRWARSRGAARIVAAAPVAAPAATRRVRREADAAVFLYEPDNFGAVGYWYASFEQVGDEEVVELLDKGRDRAQAVRQPLDRASGPAGS